MDPAAPVRLALAGLNGIAEGTLSAAILATVQQPLGVEPRVRPPPLAPFMTAGVLHRVREILVGLANDERGGMGLQASLARAVAALTGAPPLAKDDLNYAGQLMDNRVTRYVNATKKIWQRKPKSAVAHARQATDLKTEAEKLYVCPHGGTPEEPTEEVLCQMSPNEKRMTV